MCPSGARDNRVACGDSLQAPKFVALFARRQYRAPGGTRRDSKRAQALFHVAVDAEAAAAVLVHHARTRYTRRPKKRSGAVLDKLFLLSSICSAAQRAATDIGRSAVIDLHKCIGAPLSI